MVRREGRPRRAAQARKQGPDRKSLVKYVDMEGTQPPFLWEHSPRPRSSPRAVECSLRASTRATGRCLTAVRLTLVRAAISPSHHLGISRQWSFKPPLSRPPPREA